MQRFKMACTNAALQRALASSKTLNLVVRRCRADRYALTHLARRNLITSSCRKCASPQTEEPLPLPLQDGQPKVYPEKLKNIVDEISKLTLSEVASLTSLLKEKLDIKDTAMMPMMPSAAPKEAEAEPAQEEQTEFAVKLVKFEDGSKIKLIKEIKALLPEMNLVQAKKFVESAPKVVKEKVSKEESEKIKKQLEAVGAVVELE